MKARLAWLVAVVGAGAIALSATAQGGAKLAVGPDAGGYLCPDGRQLYVKSCYDNSPDASCGIVLMHLPLQRGYQQESTQTRSEITPGIAACKVYPLEFHNDGTVGLVLPKSTSPQQTAKAPAAAPASKALSTTTARDGGATLSITDGMAIGRDGVRSSLVHVAVATSYEHYVDEASRRATSQKDVVAIWSLRVIPTSNPDFPGAKAIWGEYLANCKTNSYELKRYISLDPQAKVLVGAISDASGKVARGTVNEAVVAIACQFGSPPTGPRLASAAAAIADATARAAPKTAAKPAAPAPKPAAVASPIKAPIRLPETETEKKVFEAIKTNQLQAAVSAIVRAPDGKLVPVAGLTDKQGMTALHWVTANRNAAGIRWVLDKRAAVDLADEKGRTPLKIALDNKDTRAMTMLLDSGANANFAWPGHDADLKVFKKTSELVEFLIRNAAPAAN